MKNPSLALVAGFVPIALVAGAESAYPDIAYGDTVTLTETKTDTEVSVAGTLVVASGGSGAQAASTTVKLGSPEGSSVPAEIRVTGGSFGNAHGDKNSTTVNLGEDGGSGRFLVTGGTLGIAVLNISANAQTDEDGYIDYARIEGGTAKIRRLYNEKASSIARMTVAGASTIGPEHGWYPCVYNGSGAFEVTSENGTPVYINMNNLPMTWNAAGTVVRFTGDADYSLQSKNLTYTVEYRRGFTFANNGFVKFYDNSTHRFEANGIIGAGVTNLFLSESVKLTLDKNTTNSVRDVTGDSTTIIKGAGVLEADASKRDITIDVPFGEAVSVFKTGTYAMTFGQLASDAPAIHIGEGSLLVKYDTKITNLVAAAGTSITVDGTILELAGDIDFAGDSITAINGGCITLRVDTEKQPVFRKNITVEVAEYFVDGVLQPKGTYSVGGATVSVVSSEYPFVALGNREILSENRADIGVRVYGHLFVTGGESATGRGTTVLLSSTAPHYEPAVIEVLSGTFGHGNSNYTDAKLRIGGGGGRGKVVVKGGIFAFVSAQILADTTVDDTGYIDYARVEGGTLQIRSTANETSHTGRLTVAGSSVTLMGEHGWGATTFSKGAFLIESENGTDVFWEYGNQHVTFNSSGTVVAVKGDGDVIFSQDAYSNTDITYVNFHDGCFFDNTGVVTFKGRGGLGGFYASNAFGPNSKGLHLMSGSMAKFDSGTVNTLCGVTADAINSYVYGNGTLLLDTSAREAVFDAAVQGNTLTLQKIGGGMLTVGTITTNLPNFTAADGGSVRFLGEFTASDMTFTASTDIIVDGGRLTITPGFSLATGTISVTNGGSVIVQATSSAAPVLPAGAEIKINEYYIDGVRQANGTYTIGTTSLQVATYDESSLSVWTNTDDTQTDYAFPEGSRYLGMLLKTPPDSLSFTGGDISLGSAGISVENTEASAPAYDFSLPIAVGTSQTWDFGNASAVFRGPLSSAADRAGKQTLNIKSSETLEFHMTNSTYCGELIVTARTIRVSGDNVFGDDSDDSSVTLQLRRPDGADNACYLEGATFNPPVKFDVVSDGINNYSLIVAAGTTNIFNSFSELPAWTELNANSVMEFKKGCFFPNYSRQRMHGNATLIVHERMSLGSVGLYPAIYGSSNRYLIDAEIEYRYSPTDFDIELAGDWQLLRDYCFKCGCIKGTKNGVLHLNGHRQRINILTGVGTVTSTNSPAVLELATPFGTTFTNSIVFADHAALEVTGGGTAVFNAESTTDGSIGIENANVELNGRWPNTSEVSVSGIGNLKIGVKSINPFSPDVTLSISDLASVEIPSGRHISVGTLYLNGSSEPAKPGVYTAANTAGRVIGGAIHVGQLGTLIIIR